MNFKEKYLYHQIHPLKLLVDFSTGFITTWFAWQHNIIWFLVLFLIPSVLTTWLLFQFANLYNLKNSSFGKYVQLHMTPTKEAIRFAGQILMWVAAWFHIPLLIAAGLLIIIGGWCMGLLFKRK